jgi:prevent-host-death family protein
MLSKSDIWKLQDAKARFSEVVRRARAGEPQHVTLHGKEVAVVLDPTRYNFSRKPAGKSITGRDFIEASKKYRGIADGIDFEQRGGMTFRDRSHGLFNESADDEKKP